MPTHYLPMNAAGQVARQPFFVRFSHMEVRAGRKITFSIDEHLKLPSLLSLLVKLYVSRCESVCQQLDR